MHWPELAWPAQDMFLRGNGLRIECIEGDPDVDL